MRVLLRGTSGYYRYYLQKWTVLHEIKVTYFIILLFSNHYAKKREIAFTIFGGTTKIASTDEQAIIAKRGKIS